MKKISEYVFTRLAKEVTIVEQKTGRKVLNFGPGSPDFPPSKIYTDKLKEFINESNMHLYPGYNASPVFAQALMQWYKSRFNVDLEKEELLPLLGAKDGISLMPIVTLDRNDEVLIPNPGYPPYTDPTIMFGGKAVFYDILMNEEKNIDFLELEKKVTKKTKYIWVNFPANPTGKTITLAELEQLVQFAKKHNIFIMYDNAYSEITFDGIKAPSILQVKGAKDIVIEIGSFSKTYSFAGLRMGWIVGNKTIIQALTKVKSQIDSGMWMPLQKLGAYVLTNPDEKWHKQMLENYKTRRNIIARYLAKLGLAFTLPKGALYIWAKIPDNEKNAESYSMRLLQEKQILLTPGSAFGTNGNRFVRVSFCVNIDRIKEYF